MAYQATVPVHRRLLWSAVADPERLLGAVPKLEIEAGSEHGVAARLRLRAGDKSITFRGIARLVELVPDELRAVIEIEAVHGRSDGTLDGRVQIRLWPDGDGTRVELEPEFVLSGHAPTVSPEQLVAAGVRLIPRWFAQLAGSAPQAHPAPVALAVVPEPEGEVGAERSRPAPEPEPGPEPAPVADEAAETPAPESARAESAAEPTTTPEAEPRPGPTFTLITGTGDDGVAPDAAAATAAPTPKAPLRLVGPSGPDAADDPADERDLWSERPGRFIAPLWVPAAALLGALGLLIAVLRRMARRHRDVD